MFLRSSSLKSGIHMTVQPRIDPHTHTFLRGDEDLSAMRSSGVCAAVVCAFLPVTPSASSSLLDLFTWLDTVERERLVKHDIEPIIALGIHPRCIPPVEDVEPVLDRVRELIDRKRVGAIGEIGLETGSNAEKGVLLRQLELARELQLLAIVHTPRANKSDRLSETLELIDRAGIASSKIILDHLTPELVAALDSDGRDFWMGLTVQSGKTRPEEIAALIQSRGSVHRLLVSSDVSHQPSDPCAVAWTAQRLEALGVDPTVIDRLTSFNAMEALQMTRRSIPRTREPPRRAAPPRSIHRRRGRRASRPAAGARPRRPSPLGPRL
jgi:predicted metal-dependent TIM-barrel fold hydrolase